MRVQPLLTSVYFRICCCPHAVGASFKGARQGLLRFPPLPLRNSGSCQLHRAPLQDGRTAGVEARSSFEQAHRCPGVAPLELQRNQQLQI